MTVEVKAYVWDFTLPQTPSCTTSMGLDKYSIAKAHGVDINSGEAQRFTRTITNFFWITRFRLISFPLIFSATKRINI